MANQSYFQRAFDKTTLISGNGDPSEFEKEAEFLGYYGSRLGKILRTEELKSAVTDESTQLIAVGYPEGVESGGGQLRGIVSDNGMTIPLSLEELDWRAL